MSPTKERRLPPLALTVVVIGCDEILSGSATLLSANVRDHDILLLATDSLWTYRSSR